MAEKRITPQSPDKAKEASDKAAAGVTKRSLKKASTKQLHKKAAKKS